MNIAHIAKVDIRGGAARAAYRLHRGLCDLGHDSTLVVRHKHSSDDTVIAVAPDSDTIPPQLIQASAIQTYAINANRTDLSNTPFTLPYPGIDLTHLDIIQSADILHWHWLVEFQSLTTLHQLLQLGKPVVWTLHDMWPFTGGCHSSAGCTRYQTGCFPCPQLAYDPLGLPSAILKDKQALLRAPNLTLVAPSQKIADQARGSLLFKDTPIEVIHHSIETDRFSPIPKTTARQQLGIDPDTITLAYGSEDCGQRSKGFPELAAVIESCMQNEAFATLATQKHLCLIGFGRGSDTIHTLPIPILDLGYVRSDEQLRTIYSAADVFLQPSLEESFGNMAVEALCCGTPVIAFDVGVAPDIIQPHNLGCIVPLGDTHQMAIALLDLIQHLDYWRSLAPKCHDIAATTFAQATQAHRHTTLYNSLLTHPPTHPLIHSLTYPLTYSFTLPPHLQHIFPTLALNALTQALTEQNERSPQLQQAREKLKLSRAKIANLDAQLQQTQQALERTQAELNQAQAEIDAMKSSKFWKMRTFWHKLMPF